MKRINMLSKADMVKGQGVLSAHDEQVELAREVMENRAEILENAKGSSDITHYHSINPEYYLSTFRRRKQEALVGYVHFLPETVENSISLPRFAKNIFYKYMISFYKRMDYLVTVNPVFIDKLEAYGIPREKITYDTGSGRRPLSCSVQDSFRKEKGSLTSWMWQRKCPNVNLYGRGDFRLERSLKDMKKSKHEWNTFPQMSSFWDW